MGSGAETINLLGALAAKDGHLTADSSRTYFDVSYALGAPAAGVALAMVAAPTAIVSLRAGRPLRPPAASLTLVLALAFLSPAMLFGVFAWIFGAGLLALAALSVRLHRDQPD